MNRDELRHEYETGQLDRPARVQYLRQEIEEVTGKDVPHRIHDIPEWWEDNKAVIARRLNEEESNESDTSEEDEGTNDE